LQVSFTPTSTGSRSANLSISDNAPGGPHTITLLGTATAPGINLFPSPLTFGNQNVGIASNSVVLTANNTGTADLIISALSFSGANASEFALSGVTLPITVPPGQSRGINVTFTPSAQGQRAAVLNITDNAGGSPHTVNLSGNGTQPAINLNVTTLAFGDQALNNSSAAKPVVVTNPGSGPLIISALAISGGNAADFTVTSGTLPITVEPSSTLVINVIFNPKATGPRSSALILTHNAPGSPSSISLSGNGTQPVINLSVPSIAFNIQDVNTTSPASVVTASNTGTGSLIISGLSITGLNAGDFSITSPPLPISIAPGASADIQIAFTPKATGARAASLSITHNAIGSPNSIPLSGTGRGPVISINPLSVTFANRNLNTTSPASTVSIGNTGNGDLIISSLSISGANAAEFAVTSAGLPLTINPGGSTLVSVTFTPTTAGLRSASLNVGTNAPGSPNVVALSGTGIGPAVLVNPTALDFGSLAVNTTSNPTQVTVSNSGNTDLVISNIALTGANTADFAFTAAARPITVTAGGNTTINVTFTPKQVGARTASLTITDNATGSPHTVTLQGTGSGTAQVSMQSVTVGSNLQVLATASITSVPSSDVPVTITSADPTRVLLLNALTDSSGVGAGSSSITMTIRAGNTTIFPGFWVQGLASSGSVLLNLSAPGYASSTATVSLSRAGFVLLSPQGQGADFTANSAAQDVTLNVIPALLDSASNVVAGVSTRIRGGFSTSVAVTSQNSSVGDITDSPAAFGGGSTSSAVHFTAAGTGSTLLKLTMPPGFNVPTGGSQLTATVVLPKITLNQTNVGANLQVEGAGILDAAAPSGGLAVTITSSNPSVVKLSASPTDAGATSIVLNVPVGQSFLPLFFVQAVGTAGSSAQITATATKYQTGTAPVSVTASGFVISGPSGNAGQSFSTSTISRSTELKITPVQLSTTLNVLNTGQIRGGLSVTVPVNNGNSAAGSVVSANANFGPGDLVNNNLVAFSPLAQGNAPISLGTPSVAGFTTPNAGASLTISVTQPQITIALPATTIGKDLQVLGGGTLSAPAQSGGLDITIRVSSGSGVLLSTTPTGVGSTSIVVNVPQGSTGGGSFPSYFVQSTASSGSAVIAAEAVGWQSSSVNLTLKPSGLVLRGPNGLGQAFGTLTSFGDIPLTIETWQINDATLLPERAQDLRGGLALSIDVPSSNPSVATLIGSPAGFTGGSSNTTVAFHPVGKGETIVSFSEPAGFSTPSSGGKALNSITADVN
ncbi:MAG TPA: choice-of-anchor D domain-containing protein, partial [Terriglobales bacterium]|nr:choice-of-anchor D domain-containing protein [Terriglobales bacterium]